MFSPVINSYQALNILHQCQLIIKPTGAIHYLKQQNHTGQLLHLYQYFFPQEYNQSKALPFPNVFQNEDHYSEKELEFLYLVDHYLFPLPYLEDIAENSFPVDLDHILITSVGIPWINEEEVIFDYLSPGLQALLPLSHLGREQLEETVFSDDWYSELFNISLLKIIHPEKIDREQLEALCEGQEAPIKYLFITLSALSFCTNNVWLDEINGLYTSIDLNTLPWTIDNVNYLTVQYEQAAQIVEMINLFVAWLEFDLPNNLQQVLNLWQQCTIPNPGQH